MKTQFKASFLKSIKKLDNPNIKQEIFKIIQDFESTNDPKQIKNLKKLSGYSDCYRIYEKNYFHYPGI